MIAVAGIGPLSLLLSNSSFLMFLSANSVLSISKLIKDYWEMQMLNFSLPFNQRSVGFRTIVARLWITGKAGGLAIKYYFWFVWWQRNFYRLFVIIWQKFDCRCTLYVILSKFCIFFTHMIILLQLDITFINIKCNKSFEQAEAQALCDSFDSFIFSMWHKPLNM